MLGFFVVLVILISGHANGELVLSPSSLVTTENNSLTLTCIFTGDETVATLTWRAIKKNETTYRNIGLIRADCSPLTYPVDMTLYEYACPSSKQYTWTIKKVTRQYEREKYQCAVDTPSGLIISNDVIISVLVLPMAVDIVTPGKPSVRENEEFRLTCKSSGLPKPTITWYKSGGTSSQTGSEVIINSYITTSSTSHNGLENVTSTLIFFPSRNDNGWSVYCKATNIAGQPPVVSKKVEMEVIYPPDQPIIHGFKDGGVYRVMENREGILSCSVTGGNPLASLSWDCYNGGEPISVIVDTITKSQKWLAQRGMDRTCTCKAYQYLGTKSVSVNIVTLYPPDVPTFVVNGTAISGTVQIIRNNSLSISCVSSANPQPSYTWLSVGTASEVKATGQVFTINNIQNDMKLLCKAQNTVNPTDGGMETFSSSSYIDVILLS